MRDKSDPVITSVEFVYGEKSNVDCRSRMSELFSPHHQHHHQHRTLPDRPQIDPSIHPSTAPHTGPTSLMRNGNTRVALDGAPQPVATHHQYHHCHHRRLGRITRTLCSGYMVTYLLILQMLNGWTDEEDVGL